MRKGRGNLVKLSRPGTAKLSGGDAVVTGRGRELIRDMGTAGERVRGTLMGFAALQYPMPTLAVCLSRPRSSTRLPRPDEKSRELRRQPAQ